MPKKSSKGAGRSRQVGEQKQKSPTNEQKNEKDGPITSIRANGVSVGVGFALLALYVNTLPPTVVGGDSGELIVAANELGVAHPPGYPVFTLLAKLSIMFIPFGSPAWRVNFMNACFASATGAILHAVLLRLNCGVVGSLFGVAAFCLNQLTWTWSVCAEVFSLNNFFTAGLMWLVLKFSQSSTPNQALSSAKCGALFCGLSLCNQHTIALYVLCVALFVLNGLRNHQILTVLNCAKIGLCGLLGLSPYLYLPISSSLNIARWTWGWHLSLHGLLNHLLRMEYGTFDLGKDQAGSGLYDNLSAYWSHAQNNMCLVTPYLAALSILFILFYKERRRSRNVLLLYVFMMLVYTLFFAWRANLDINNALLKGVVERFWMQTDIVLVVLATVGLHSCLRWITDALLNSEKQQQMAANVRSLMLTLVAIAVIFCQFRNYAICDQSKNTLVKEFGQSLFDSVPKNSLILTKGDLPGNTIRYLQFCENVRPNLPVIDQEVLSYKWSINWTKKFLPKVKIPGDFWHLRDDDKWPGGETSFCFNTFLLANYKRFPGGIYVCIGMQERDSSWSADFDLIPYGVCHKVVKKGTPFDIEKYISQTQALGDNWPYPCKGFPNTSWEKVANDEMWNAKISSAFFLYKVASSNSDVPTKTNLFLAAYELYKRAMSRHVENSVPPFWHKNFALVCEKLLHLEHGEDREKMLQQGIHHFEAYLELQNDDPDNEKIKGAIKVLKERQLMSKQLDEVEETADRMMDRLDKLSKKEVPKS